MPFKPMKRRDFERWIRQYGWSLRKAGMDWSLIDAENNVIVPNMIITHPGNEIVPMCVKKAKMALQKRGLD